ncbi:hypothetical protein HWV62_28136 [Athelia sp. TMB]|nr:hypothetical protein HWV62_28136 [Athelia sp. TMB]
MYRFPALQRVSCRAISIVEEDVKRFTSNHSDWEGLGRCIRDSSAVVIQYLWDQEVSERHQAVEKLNRFLDTLTNIKEEIATLQQPAKPGRPRSFKKDPRLIANMKGRVDTAMKDFGIRPKGAKDFRGDTKQLLTKILERYKAWAVVQEPTSATVVTGPETSGPTHELILPAPKSRDSLISHKLSVSDDTSSFASRDRESWLDDGSSIVSFEPLSLESTSHNANSSHGAPADSERINDRLLAPAMATLRLALDKLSYAEGASWNPKLTCLPGTRKTILSLINFWAHELNDQNIFWVKGVAGSGKSAIAQTVAQMLYLEGILASSFFFNRDVASRNTPKSLFTTIARDIANKYPALAADISMALENELALASAPLSRQFDALIAGPLRRHSFDGPIVVVIDALNESTCAGADTDLLDILSTEAANLPPQFRIFVTSRPTRNIEDFLSGRHHIKEHRIDIDTSENREDIAAYVDSQLLSQELRFKIGSDRLDEALIRDLKSRSEGLFIWIATVFSYLSSAYNPREKLSALLSSTISQPFPDPYKKMDLLYTAILDACGAWDDSNFCDDYQLVMGAIMAAKRPISLAALRALYGDIQDVPSLQRLLRRFGSVLLGFHDEHEPIRILHISFREFITDRAASAPQTEKFYISEQKHSQKLAVLCLKTVAHEFAATAISGAGYLSVDDESAPGIPKLTGVSEHLLYACESLNDHIADVMSPDIIATHIQHFLSRDRLRWVEIVVSQGVFRGALPIRRWLFDKAPTLLKIHNDKFLASVLVSLAKRLSYVGRFEEGLIASQEASELYRVLAANEPAVFRPALAWSLNDISVRLSHLGRREDALAICEEALQLYRALAAKRTAMINNGLAACLNNLSNYLSDVGDHEKGLVICQEAVSLQRMLATKRPAKLNVNLASSIASLSNRLSAVGRREDALTAMQEAVALYRDLVEKRPTGFNQELAMALSSFSNCLWALGHHQEALGAIEESVKLCRTLVKDRPQVFNAQLANSLSSLSTRLVSLCQWEQGLEAAQEAVKLHRALATGTERPAALCADLAFSLENLSIIFSNLDRRSKALRAIQEAIELYRSLAVKRPATFNLNLAISLNNLSRILLGIRRKEEAVGAAQEASDILHSLVAQRPAHSKCDGELARSKRLLLACKSNDEQAREESAEPMSPGENTHFLINISPRPSMSTTMVTSAVLPKLTVAVATTISGFSFDWLIPTSYSYRSLSKACISRWSLVFILVVVPFTVSVTFNIRVMNQNLVPHQDACTPQSEGSNFGAV